MKTQRAEQTDEALTTRRGFLRGTAATAGLLALGELGRVGTALSQTALPSPDASGSSTSSSLMMENRSFDHYLGWLPDADGRQKGLTYVDDGGRGAHDLPAGAGLSGLRAPGPGPLLRGRSRRVQRRRLRWMAARGRQRPIRDRLLHAEGSGLLRRGGRALDGRAIATSPPSWRRRSRTASTSTRHRPIASPTPSSSARCRRSGIGSRRPASTGRYYFSDVPFLALWGAKYLPIARPFAGFLADAAAGTLPHVSFVEPRFLGEELGLSDGRPPVRRHPERPGLPQSRLSRGHHQPGLVAHGARDQLRRVGRILRSRAAADGADS